MGTQNPNNDGAFNPQTGLFNDHQQDVEKCNTALEKIKDLQPVQDFINNFHGAYMAYKGAAEAQVAQEYDEAKGTLTVAEKSIELRSLWSTTDEVYRNYKDIQDKRVKHCTEDINKAITIGSPSNISRINHILSTDAKHKAGTQENLTHILNVLTAAPQKINEAVTSKYTNIIGNANVSTIIAGKDASGTHYHNFSVDQVLNACSVGKKYKPSECLQLSDPNETESYAKGDGIPRMKIPSDLHTAISEVFLQDKTTKNSNAKALQENPYLRYKKHSAPYHISWEEYEKRINNKMIGEEPNGSGKYDGLPATILSSAIQSWCNEFANFYENVLGVCAGENEKCAQKIATIFDQFAEYVLDQTDAIPNPQDPPANDDSTTTGSGSSSGITGGGSSGSGTGAGTGDGNGTGNTSNPAKHDPKDSSKQDTKDDKKTDTTSGAADGIGSVLSSLGDTASGIGSGVGQGISQGLQGIGSAIGSGVQGIGSAIGSAAQLGGGASDDSSTDSQEKDAHVARVDSDKVDATTDGGYTIKDGKLIPQTTENPQDTDGVLVDPDSTNDPDVQTTDTQTDTTETTNVKVATAEPAQPVAPQPAEDTDDADLEAIVL